MKTERRLSGTRRLYGTLTYVRSRTTVGDGIVSSSECHTNPFDATTSARSRSTRTRARRAGTTESGSKLALSTSARGIGGSVPVDVERG